jgi:hypothetical protein
LCAQHRQVGIAVDFVILAVDIDGLTLRSLTMVS